MTKEKEHKFKVGDEVVANCDARFLDTTMNCISSVYKRGYKTIVKQIDYKKGLFLMHCDASSWHFISEWDLAESEPTYPIKIETKCGIASINGYGQIRIYEDCTNQKINMIDETELEQFQDIIKQAIKVRDRKCQ